MRIVVAGGAGFVGSHLCHRLVAEGHDVVALDNLSTGSAANVAPLRDAPGFSLIVHDVVRPVLDVVRGPLDVVFHLASPASPDDYDRLPLETLAVNSDGTRNLLDLAQARGAAFLYTSTSEIYGDPLVHPQPEAYWGNVDPIGPRACYDEAKRFGEALVTSYRRVHGVRAAIVRIFNTYGPGMRLDDGRVIPELASAALDGRPLPVHGDGMQTRSFQYVEDLVAALVTIGLDPQLDGLVLNIGNPHEVTMNELAERVAALVPGAGPVVHVPGRPGDPQRRRPDIDRIRDRYGWEPAVDLDEGLRRTLEPLLGARTTTFDASLEHIPAAPAVGGEVS
jgi:dTDP-glucose 4,6-dehydratase